MFSQLVQGGLRALIHNNVLNNLLENETIPQSFKKQYGNLFGTSGEIDKESGSFKPNEG